MKKPLLKLIFAVLFVMAVIFVGRDMIVQAAVGSVCRATTGLNLSIDSFRSSLLSSTFNIKGLKLFNPPAYSEKVMFFIPEVYVGFDLGSALAGKPHLKEVRLHLAELVIERNKEGKLNLSELKPADSKKKDSPQVKPSAAPNVQIDVLKLQIDKVIYKDFSKVAPISQEFNLNINETYRDIKDVRALAPIIIGHVLRNRALGALTNFRVDDLLQNFQAGGINVADMGLDKISGIFSSGVGQTAQGVVGSVADQLGSLFGTPKKK